MAQTIIKVACEKISSVISAVASFFMTTIPQWIQNGVNSIKNKFIELASSVSNIFTSIRNWISEKVNSAKETAINGFWSLVNGATSTLYNLIGRVNSVFNNIKSTISGWASAAWNWGYDFITGLTRGFVSGMQGLLSKVRNLASSIRSYLHFSRPDVGPLRDYETWMPDFMAGMAKGIDKNMYRVTDAVQRVANAMQMNMPNMNAALAVNGSGVNVNNAVTVQIGNKQFDAYIVNTAQKGISHNQRAGMRAKGA